MKVLRTPDERFADLPDFPYPPHYAEVTAEGGTKLRLHYLDPENPVTRKPNFGDQFLYWLAQLHFGRFAGLSVEILWTVLGLVPLALFVTGGFMWWNRVLSPWLKRSAQARAEMNHDNTPQPQSSLGD